MSLEKRVTALIVEQLGISAEEAVVAASFLDDLGADSLDIVELVMSLEEEFDIEVQFNSNSPAEGDIDISSVASIVLAVEKMVAEQA